METTENVEMKVTTKVTDYELDGMIGRAFMRISRGIAFIVASMIVDLSPIVFGLCVFILLAFNVVHMANPVQLDESNKLFLLNTLQWTAIGLIGVVLGKIPHIDDFLNWLNPVKTK